MLIKQLRPLLRSKPFRYLLIIAGIAATFLILKFSDSAPFMFIGIIWFFLLLVMSLSSKRSAIKLWGVNFCAVVLALTSYETYLLIKSNELYISREHLQKEYLTNKFLGYAPTRNEKISAAKYYKDEVVFNAEYTIDTNGLRISPPNDILKNKGCILFFGDSFTFGVGVSDTESMPYQTGIKSGGEYKIYNFGFGGYGPHQMLSELEHGIVKKIVSCQGTIYGIYQAIPDHINRAAGLSFWDYYGPRYILGTNGAVKFAGNFSDEKLPKIIVKYLNKSIIYRDIIGNRRYFDREKDIALYIGIVNSARKSFESQYPEGKFHIIFWDNRSGTDEKQWKTSEWNYILKELQKTGVNLHPVSKIIPDYPYKRLKYDLSPYDTHPNALTHSIIANYITNTILN